LRVPFTHGRRRSRKSLKWIRPPLLPTAAPREDSACFYPSCSSRSLRARGSERPFPTSSLHPRSFSWNRRSSLSPLPLSSSLFCMLGSPQIIEPMARLSVPFFNAGCFFIWKIFDVKVRFWFLSSIPFSPMSRTPRSPSGVVIRSDSRALTSLFPSDAERRFRGNYFLGLNPLPLLISIIDPLRETVLDSCKKGPRTKRIFRNK